MVGLVDAGRIIRPVKIGDSEVVCTGISLDGLVLLLDRFPEFKALLTPKRGEELDTGKLSVEGLLKMGPRIIGAIIAAGIDEAGVAAAENAAKVLPIGYQVKLIKEIIDLTFPGGLGPFVEDLRSIGLLGKADDASAGTGRGPAMSSLSKPESSSEAATSTR